MKAISERYWDDMLFRWQCTGEIHCASDSGSPAAVNSVNTCSWNCQTGLLCFMKVLPPGCYSSRRMKCKSFLRRQMNNTAGPPRTRVVRMPWEGLLYLLSRKMAWVHLVLCIHLSPRTVCPTYLWFTWCVSSNIHPPFFSSLAQLERWLSTSLLFMSSFLLFLQWSQSPGPGQCWSRLTELGSILTSAPHLLG